MVQKTAYGIALLFLAILTPEDIRERRISVSRLLLFAISGFAFRLAVSSFSYYEMIGCLITGGFLILLSILTKEEIGFGDGIAVTVLGLWTGGWFTFITVCIALLLSGICGCLFWALHKRETVPFMPFLLIGMEVSLLYA